MKKIILTGVTGFRNRGVEALVKTKVTQLLSRTQAEIVILSATPDYDALHYKHARVRFAQDVFATIYGRALSKLGPFSRFLTYAGSEVKKATEQYLQIFEEIKTSDLVIATGGDIFSNAYSLSTYLMHLKPLEIAQEAGVPVVFLGHSIGLFKDDFSANKWSAIAKKSPLISLREKVTYDYVIKDLGINQNKVKWAADTSFLLEPFRKHELQSLMDYYGLKQKQFIALSVSQGIQLFSQLTSDEHLDAWVNMINVLVSLTGLDIVLIPHVQEIYAVNNDAILATKILQKLNYPANVKIMAADHRVEELKSVISQAEFLVAERMHAAMAGLSTGVATVAVSYSIKARGILTDMYDETLTQAAMISSKDFLELTKAEELVTKAWQKREELREKLQETLPAAKARALDNFTLLDPLLS